MKTAELVGVALDYAVLRARGFPMQKALRALVSYNKGKPYHPASNADQAYGVISEAKIGTSPQYDGRWLAHRHDTGTNQYGPTLLIAAMRCFVASVFGEEIDIPEELM